MCGIAGFCNYKCESEGKSKAIIHKMTETFAYRGPDDSGYFIDDKITFGFRRLSIIDIEGGNQPHYNEDKNIISICNGEIFNYKELKQELIAKGHRFYTKNDVEVLVHLYEEYGTEFLNKLNGQFAFAIYDKRKSIIFLARDHVGIAPLFYTVKKGAFIFASEIKAILAHPEVEREVDMTGLDQMLTFPGLVSPRTMFKDIKALKPGHFLIVSEQDVHLKEYWDLVYPHEKDIDFSKDQKYYKETLDELLHRAVVYRLNADVPVGFYLSGGLDSSLIAALINKNRPDTRWDSFSITFTDPDIDERHYQQLMAKRVGSRHNEIVFDWHDIINRLKSAVFHGETPLKESYNTCSLALSELVHKNDIKVVLTGEGSDEMFAGYVGYRFDGLRGESDPDDLDIYALMEQDIRQTLWGDSNFFYERNFYEFNETKLALYSESMAASFGSFDCTKKELVDKSKITDRHHIHKRSYIDFKLRLSDHLLADHGERVAYANSVEARYPFLDINVIEFMKTIPPNMFIKGDEEKHILKEVGRKYLPHDIVDRRKFAFVAPGSPYCLRQNVEWVNDLLSFDRIKKEGIFNPHTVEHLKKQSLRDNHNINQTFENDLLMIVMTFEIFLDVL